MTLIRPPGLKGAQIKGTTDKTSVVCLVATRETLRATHLGMQEQQSKIRRAQKTLQDAEAKTRQVDLPIQWLHFLGLQIQAGKLVEYQLLSEWRKSNREKVSRLNSQIRPQLDEISIAFGNQSGFPELTNWQLRRYSMAALKARPKIRAQMLKAIA